MKAVKQRLRQALSQRQKQQFVDASLVSSAVLLPIYRKCGQCYILFTKRTEKVKEHKGQISFPGGAYQEEDGTLLATALRECAEEIGLASKEVEVLGELDDIATKTTGYVISPFVAFIPRPHQFKVNSGEVKEIVEVPVSELLDKNSWREEPEVISGKTVTSCSFHYQGMVIWGATAGILNQFLDILAGVIEPGREVYQTAGGESSLI